MREFTAYASGVNEAREIAGFALAGVPVGASASNLREGAIQSILRSEGPVFLDSGAFSEVRFSPQTQRRRLLVDDNPQSLHARLAWASRLTEALRDPEIGRASCRERV